MAVNRVGRQNSKSLESRRHEVMCCCYTSESGCRHVTKDLDSSPSFFNTGMDRDEYISSVRQRIRVNKSH